MTILIFLVIFLIFVSAFFSCSETALTGSSEAKIHKLKTEGSKRAEKVTRLIKDKNLISSIMIANNAVNISASAIATALTIEHFGESSLVYISIIMTFVIIIFGEILPKTYAFENPEKVSLAVAPIFIWIVKILKPINYFIGKIVNVLLLPLRLSKGKGLTDFDAKEVIKGAIDFHHEEGEVVTEDKNMLGSILDLETTTVSEIMHHRKDMEIVSLSRTTDEIISKVLASAHTRIPVYKNTAENIVGILHSKTLARALYAEGNDSSKVEIEKIITEPWFVPETTTLKDQLVNFRQKRNHFAIVVDEYGAIIGFITLEDLLEEIVGNIEDEHDVSQYNIEVTEDGSFIVDGAIPIRDINREMNLDLPNDEATTIAGLIILETELIPEVGQIFSIHGFRFEILKKKRNQITRVKISKIM
jgi:Mg2+/Co2+ transporter CorB